MTLDIPHTPATPRQGRSRISEVAQGDRQRAFARAKRHSRLVRVLKVGLPLMAVVSTGALLFSPTMLVHVLYPAGNASVGSVQITTDQLRMVNPRFDGFTSDKGHYVVTAKAATQMLDNPNVMQLETVHGHLVQVDNSWTDITSVAGSYQTQTKALQLSKGVVITTSTDAKVVLDHADIDVDKKIARSDADVAMSMPSGTLNGRGLLVDNLKKQLVLYDAVTAHLVPPPHVLAAGDDPDAVPPDPTAPAPAIAATVAAPGALSFAPAMSDAPVDIDSKKLELLDTAKTATFSGAVRAVQAGTVIRSEKMIVGYASAPGANPASLTSTGPSAQNLNYVTNAGSVVITTADGRKALCDQSRYDAKANTMVLAGNVVLSQSTSELHGDMVVYDMAAKRTHVTAKNRVSGHFEQAPAQAVGLRTGAVQPAIGLSGLGASHGATDIAADSLEIANSDNRATFQGTVIVTQHGNKLTGERLDIDMTKRHMTMSGPGRVSGQFTPDPATVANAKSPKTPTAGADGEAVAPANSFAGLAANNGEPTNIEADTLSVQDDLGQATFTGKVLVVHGGDRISTDTLTVDYVASGTAAPNQDGTQLKQIRGKGHVVIHTPDAQAATGDALLYDPGHNKMVISGNVTLMQGKNVVHGEKLVVDLLTGEGHVENRGDDATGSAAPAKSAAPNSRDQAIFYPGENNPSGGLPAPGMPFPVKPKQGMSASDVLVAPPGQ